MLRNLARDIREQFAAGQEADVVVIESLDGKRRLRTPSKYFTRVDSTTMVSVSSEVFNASGHCFNPKELVYLRQGSWTSNVVEVAFISYCSDHVIFHLKAMRA